MGPRTGSESEGASAGTPRIPEEDFQHRRDAFQTIRHHCLRTLVVGDTWYIVGGEWWKAFEAYSREEGAPNPGPINNNSLLQNPTTTRLKNNLTEEVDYQLIHEDGWDLLKKRFGLFPGTPALPRCVYQTGLFSIQKKVEIQLVDVRLALFSTPNDETVLQVSRGDSFKHFVNNVKSKLMLGADTKFRAFIVHDDKLELIDLDKHLGSVERVQVDDTGLLHDGMLIHIDTMDEQGNWALEPRLYDGSAPKAAAPSSPPKSIPSTSSAPQLHSSGPITSQYGAASSFMTRSGWRSGESGTPGLCGLQNLGNTCFMNSALQCLSNCPSLTEFFLSEEWIKDVNEENPLGMHGRLAKAYATLVKQLWSGEAGSFIPREFKYTVGQFNPTFSGYHQQDSQELMAFLLDGLHEDLNRIRKKPYVELKEADGRPDDEVAKEAWADYKLRNDSIITDLLHGQLKSTLICPVCSKKEQVSVKFDPFCFLSVPLPVKREKQITVTLVSADFSFTKYKVGVAKYGARGRDVVEELSKLSGVSVERLDLAEVYESRVRNLYSFTDVLYDVKERDNLYAFEMPPGTTQKDLQIVLYQRCKARFARGGHGDGWNLTAQPIVFRFPKDHLTASALHSAVNSLARKVFRNLPEEEEEWWTKGGSDGAWNPESESGDRSSSPTNGDDSGMEDGGQGSPMETEDVPGTSAEPSGQRRLYEIRRVNSFGATLTNNSDPLPRSQPEADETLATVLNAPNYLSVDWDSEAYAKFVSTTSLDVAEDESARQTPRKDIDLSDCIRLFEEKEKLGKDDLWYCPQCKEHREASKQMGIWEAPRLLVVHLKRFSYTRTLRDKIEATVKFPIRGLDMGPFILSNKQQQPILYDLLAVSNHMGGLGGGHYTAFALNKNSNRWYNFDDSHVSPVSEDSIQSKMAYVLVYALRTTIGPESDPNVEREMDD